MSNTPTVSREPRHFAYIDAVRGMAFVGVLLVHAAYSVGEFRGRDLICGEFGVQLFFLASAVTLCHSMAKRQEDDKYPVLYFYLRRLFRIAPLFWCGLIFYWSFPNVMPRFWLGQWAPQGVRTSYFPLTALFLHGWHPYTFNSIVPGGWSIAVEMTFYVFFPFLFRFLNSITRTMVAALASLLYFKALPWVDVRLHRHLFPGIPGPVWDFFINRWFPSQLPVFLIGFFIYQLLQLDAIKKLAKNAVWANCLFFFCCLTLVSLLRGSSGFWPIYLLIILTLGGIVISMSGGVLRWLVTSPLCYVGRISYSCYLIQFAALGIALKLLGIHLTADAAIFEAGSRGLNFVAFSKIVLIALPLTVSLASVTMHVIENPGIALGRRVIKRISALTPAYEKSNGKTVYPTEKVDVVATRNRTVV